MYGKQTVNCQWLSVLALFLYCSDSKSRVVNVFVLGKPFITILLTFSLTTGSSTVGP